ncbi:unnamed protein product [Heligmosomoides polygyrus]|uniref:Uncharacterized protein n=1 Tax=Heligmosomoides polygyrus TaxID=6339 RepID=A0A183FS02_HELPZ|nr:unnamed protein product [Heligmosomoides polygyrus]
MQTIVAGPTGGCHAVTADRGLVGLNCSVTQSRVETQYKEAVFNAIEAIKKEFGGQLQQLKDEMIPLKEKSCAIAAYELAANRPARTLSAPPPSDVHITKACQNKQNSLDVIEQSASTNSDSIDRFTEQELIGDVELSEDNPDLAQIDEEELLSDPPM